jgi:molybdopterin converting factor subunit 1
MTIRLRFFAMLRERAGAGELQQEVPGSTTVRSLWQMIREQHPALAAYGGPVRFAVNQAYVDSETVLQDNDEVAFIPPVSGG